jgi:hypothetical protein
MKAGAMSRAKARLMRLRFALTGRTKRVAADCNDRTDADADDLDSYHDCYAESWKIGPIEQ